jgi:hypothetical protein
MAKNAFDFSVSLRVTHPALSATELAQLLGMTPRYSWTVGDPRTTPKGTELGGVRDASYCSFDAGKGADGEVAVLLRTVVARLSEREDALQTIRSTGGEIMLLVYWHADGDEGETFDTALLGSMAKLGIELGLNVLALGEICADA